MRIQSRNGASLALSLITLVMTAACSFHDPPLHGRTDDPDAGLRPALLLPPPGALAPTNLRVVLVALPGRVVPVAGTVALRDAASDAEVASDVVISPTCPAAGATCLLLSPRGPLLPLHAYQVSVSGAAPLSFSTGAGPDEEAAGARVTTTSSDGCTVVRVAASEPVTAELAILPDRIVASATVGTVHELAVPGTAGTQLAARLRLVDLAWNESTWQLALTGPAPPRWTITEVLANPRGPEPAQEWVEVASLASEPQSLAGLRLGDGSGWSALPDVTVPPGGRALIVGSGYDPAAPGGDVPPAAGTPLARVASAGLAQGGLANRGETLVLADAAGEPVSVFTAYFDTSASSWQGRSVERVRPGACDVRANQAPNGDNSATPGATNSVEQ
jgi:hypothetical protein